MRWFLREPGSIMGTSYELQSVVFEGVNGGFIRKHHGVQ